MAPGGGIAAGGPGTVATGDCISVEGPATVTVGGTIFVRASLTSGDGISAGRPGTVVIGDGIAAAGGLATATTDGCGVVIDGSAVVPMGLSSGWVLPCFRSIRSIAWVYNTSLCCFINFSMSATL